MRSLRNRIFNNERNPGNFRQRDLGNVSSTKVIMDANRGMDQRRAHLIIMQPAAPRSTLMCWKPRKKHPRGQHNYFNQPPRNAQIRKKNATSEISSKIITTSSIHRTRSSVIRTLSNMESRPRMPPRIDKTISFPSNLQDWNRQENNTVVIVPVQLSPLDCIKKKQDQMEIVDGEWSSTTKRLIRKQFPTHIHIQISTKC